MNINNGNRRLIINMSANIVSYGTTLLISFMLTPYLINTIGKDAYSFYPLSNNIISYMAILVNGLNTMASRYVTISLSKKDLDDANTYFSSMFFSNLILVGLMLIPMIILVACVDRFLSIPINLISSVRVLFSFSFASMVINIIFANFGIATFAKNRIDLRSLQELILSIIRLVLFIFFFSFFSPSIAYIGIIAFILANLTAIFQIFYTKKLLPEIRLNRTKFNIIYVKEVFLSGIWNSLNTLGSILLTSTSLIMANIFYGASSAGEYSIVQVVPNFINGLISMLTGVFFPMIMISFAQNDRNELLKVVKKAQSIVGVLSVTIIGTFIGFIALFFNLWVPKENASVLVLLSTITILPHILIGCMWSINGLNVAMNKVKFPALFLIGAGLCNILFSYVCFKFFDLGLISLVSVSSVIQIIWIAVFMPLYASKNLNIKYTTFYPLLIKGVCCCLIAFGLATALLHFFSIDNWIEFMFIGGSSGILSLSVNALIMIGFKDIKSIFKK